MGNLLYSTGFEGGTTPSGWGTSSPWASGTAQAKVGTGEWQMTGTASVVCTGPTASDSALGSTTVGDQVADCWFYIDAAATTYAGLDLRMTAPGPASFSGYRFDFLGGPVSSGQQTATIYKNGATLLASQVYGTNLAGELIVTGWYRVIATAIGGVQTLSVQRASDSKWAAWSGGSGSWVSTQTVLLTTTDTSIAGSASYAAAHYYVTGSPAAGVGIDEFNLYDNGSPGTIVNIASVGVSTIMGANVAVGPPPATTLTVASVSALSRFGVNTYYTPPVTTLSPAGIIVRAVMGANVAVGPPPVTTLNVASVPTFGRFGTNILTGPPVTALTLAGVVVSAVMGANVAVGPPPVTTLVVASAGVAQVFGAAVAIGPPPVTTLNVASVPAPFLFGTQTIMQGVSAPGGGYFPDNYDPGMVYTVIIVVGNELIVITTGPSGLA